MARHRREVLLCAARAIAWPRSSAGLEISAATFIAYLNIRRWCIRASFARKTRPKPGHACRAGTSTDLKADNPSSTCACARCASWRSRDRKRFDGPVAKKKAGLEALLGSEAETVVRHIRWGNGGRLRDKFSTAQDLGRPPQPGFDTGTRARSWRDSTQAMIDKERGLPSFRVAEGLACAP